MRRRGDVNKTARGTNSDVLSLEYHIACAEAHLKHAGELCKDMRITTNVMYVYHPNAWFPQSVSRYMIQLRWNASNTIAWMEKEGRISE